MSLIDRLKKFFDPGSPTLAKTSSFGPVVRPATFPYHLRQTLGWPASNFHSVAWSPDGQPIAAGSEDRCIRIWNITTGDLEQLLEGHQSSVRSVAWSPDGSRLASGSDDQTVRVWEVSSGRALRTLAGHQNFVQSVAWSPDGSHLASGSADGEVRLWSTETWSAVARHATPSPKYFLLDVSFGAVTSAAEQFDNDDIAVRSWPITGDDTVVVTASSSVHSTSAKVVLVGESNVGKSCLALRLGGVASSRDGQRDDAV
ncbi:MAG: hypothetical protein FJ147_23805 [Deltaproteobacteria bacterium]|nr:hypothetical protein [Deltaproteobacteria bacterium]